MYRAPNTAITVHAFTTEPPDLWSKDGAVYSKRFPSHKQADAEAKRLTDTGEYAFATVFEGDEPTVGWSAPQH